ncbi:pseudouridine synthase [Magnetococcus marinus MC-1]|uniref:Pseudouridine synthase n=1 Tax=Magnetococcus marinus (strain ATCC BAA-1437 / JCM 17883 / MC-1) TaxID=156889 RepID=A0L7F8_MAGMM|nr:RNA pseudouridine synthase [Magnetococcus marinus]ABK43901.1 pseudouridine synthase [Magnetococcus marinus MC-1]
MKTKTITANDLESRLLYRDGLLLIINKPAGIPVHAGPGGGANLEALFGGLRFGLPKAPALAHRLDRDTSGCLVLGRHAKALSKLGKLFSQGKVQKTYWAVVQGGPPQAQGSMDFPLYKISTAQQGWRMVVDPEQGKSSLTLYRVLGRSATHSWLELTPKTGRTHQIRVHCAHVGLPIEGDLQYGAAPSEPQLTLHLHARQIILPISASKAPINVSAPPPRAMRGLLEQCGYRAEAWPSTRFEPHTRADETGHGAA